MQAGSGGKTESVTNPVKVASLVMGGGFPVRIQTMWKEPLGTLEPPLLERIEALGSLGCELLRFAVPGMAEADALGELAGRVAMPLVADIHFDWRLALRCLDHPIAKIRINPGNIGAAWKVEEVVRKARDRAVPIRIGVNAGSLPLDLRGSADPVVALVAAAERELELLARLDFPLVVVSLKSSDVRTTVEANRLFSRRHRVPLHLGVTEAGPLIPGLVKSTLALSELLKEGIGDTVRVSLSDTPESEVLAARSILQQSGVRDLGPELISCPTCGRTTIDVRKLVEEVQQAIHSSGKKVRVAVMGCPVNGPGEARHADLGIAGAGSQALIFRKGEVIRRVPADQAREALLEELRRI